MAAGATPSAAAAPQPRQCPLCVRSAASALHPCLASHVQVVVKDDVTRGIVGEAILDLAR
jgi:hypothetical protein